MLIIHLPRKGLVFKSKDGTKTYYYNPITNIGKYEPFNITETIYLPNNWVIVKQPQKNSYFYNVTTGKSQYILPDEAEVNKLEGTRESLIDYYKEHGISLQDYGTVGAVYNALGIGNVSSGITKITAGCENMKTNLFNFLTNLLNNNPNIISLDLSNCDLLTWPSTSAEQEALRRFDYLPDFIEFILELLAEFTNLQVIRINTYFFKNTGGDGTTIQDYYADIYKMFKLFLPNVKIIDTAYNSWQSFYKEFFDWFDWFGPPESVPLWRLAGIPLKVMIKNFLDRGFNPQEGYDGLLVQIIPNNHELFLNYKYTEFLGDLARREQVNDESMQNIIEIFTMFLNKGVDPRVRRLIQYDQIDYVDNEAFIVMIKSRLIDIIYQINPLAVPDELLYTYLPITWNDIEPIDIYDVEDEDTPYDIILEQQFKRYSKRLRDFTR